MFSLIISIIAIALVVVLAGASLYYGGDAFNKGTAKGEAAKVINEGQQIQGAVTLYKVDNGGTQPSAMADLSPNYMSVELDHWTLTDDGSDGIFDSVVTTVSSAEVCAELAAAGNGQATCTTAGEDHTVVYAL